MSDKFNPEDMPVLNLNTTSTTRYEASRFLDNPEAIAAYLAESMKAADTEGLIHALAEVAKSKGINKVSKDAGVNRESLYKALKSSAKPRFETIRKLMTAMGVELTVQPIKGPEGPSKVVAQKTDKPPVAATKNSAKTTARKPIQAKTEPDATRTPSKPAAAKPAAPERRLGVPGLDNTNNKKRPHEGMELSASK
jgi:probable addiction module antidote protein